LAVTCTVNLITIVTGVSRDSQLRGLYYKHFTIVNYDCSDRKGSL